MKRLMILMLLGLFGTAVVGCDYDEHHHDWDHDRHVTRTEIHRDGPYYDHHREGYVETRTDYYH